MESNTVITSKVGTSEGDSLQVLIEKTKVLEKSVGGIVRFIQESSVKDYGDKNQGLEDFPTCITLPTGGSLATVTGQNCGNPRT